MDTLRVERCESRREEVSLLLVIPFEHDPVTGLQQQRQRLLNVTGCEQFALQKVRDADEASVLVAPARVPDPRRVGDRFVDRRRNGSGIAHRNSTVSNEG
jgi:hypothetical protein